MPTTAKDYGWRGVNLLILAGWLAYVCIFDRNLLAIQVAALFMVMVSVSDFVTAHRPGLVECTLAVQLATRAGAMRI